MKNVRRVLTAYRDGMRSGLVEAGVALAEATQRQDFASVPEIAQQTDTLRHMYALITAVDAVLAEQLPGDGDPEAMIG
jgi:hypothetical protein